MGNDPPHIMFCTVRAIDTNKDTLNNFLATKQFLVNMVTQEIVEKMNLTSQIIPAYEREFEFELANLTPIASIKVKPPRVEESPITMECELVYHYTLEKQIILLMKI